MTVHSEAIQKTLRSIVGISCSPTCLLVSRTDYGVLDGLSDVIKRVAVRRNFHPQPTLNPLLRSLSFALRVVIQKWMPVVYAVSPDFVSSLNHATKQLDVLVAPVRFTPV